MCQRSAAQLSSWVIGIAIATVIAMTVSVSGRESGIETPDYVTAGVRSF